MGIFQLDKIVHLRSSFRSQGKLTEQDTYFNWHAETPQSHQASKIASLKDSLHKANEKLKIQEVSKTKNI